MIFIWFIFDLVLLTPHAVFLLHKLDMNEIMKQIKITAYKICFSAVFEWCNNNYGHFLINIEVIKRKIIYYQRQSSFDGRQGINFGLQFIIECFDKDNVHWIICTTTITPYLHLVLLEFKLLIPHIYSFISKYSYCQRKMNLYK